MPQGQLPIFPAELTLINNQVGFQKCDGIVSYFHGHLVTFRHHEDDAASFRFITSQMVDNEVAKQVEIVNAFGVSVISVKRYVKIFREKGPAVFFEEKRRRGAHVLKEDVLAKAQGFLNKGESIPKVAKMLNIKADTLRKAVKVGRLKKGLNLYPRRQSIRQERKEYQRQSSGHGTGLHKGVGAVSSGNGQTTWRGGPCVSSGRGCPISRSFVCPPGASVQRVVGFRACGI